MLTDRFLGGCLTIHLHLNWGSHNMRALCIFDCVLWLFDWVKSNMWSSLGTSCAKSLGTTCGNMWTSLPLELDQPEHAHNTLSVCCIARALTCSACACVASSSCLPPPHSMSTESGLHLDQAVAEQNREHVHHKPCLSLPHDLACSDLSCVVDLHESPL